MSIRTRRLEALRKEIGRAVKSMIEAHEREVMARIERIHHEGELARSLSELIQMAMDQ